LIWIFNSVEGLLAPVVAWIFQRFDAEPVSGVGFGITVVLIFVVGVITANVIGRKMVRWSESMLARVPIIRHFYVAFREVFQGFSDSNANAFLAVVLVEFPAKRMWTVGFITREDVDKDGKPLISVFVPTAPNPIGGFIEILREEDIIRTSIPVQDALKMVISGGRMSPHGLGESLTVARLQEKADKQNKP